MTSFERLERGGLRRTAGRRNSWTTAAGAPARVEDVRRIAALRIPPNWKDVFVAPSASAKLQAVGRDAAGRWQYVYHEASVRRSDRRKYSRLVRFIQALPKLRRAVASDLRGTELSKARVVACMLRILMCRFIRPGSPGYEKKENHSYGLTTLRRRHVRFEGAAAVLDFKGKGGKQLHIELRDRAALRVLRELLEQPGEPLFRFRGAEGSLIRVGPELLNGVIHETMDPEFSAKDFRTWGGSLLCAGALARAAAGGAKPTKKLASQAVRETSEALHNTPAVARASYIAPRILDTFEEGRTVESPVDSIDALATRPDLDAAEKGLLDLLAPRGGAS